MQRFIAGSDDHKLLTAVAPDKVFITYAIFQNGPHASQHTVTGQMTMGVIHLFEIV
ncbi:hypothetical protein D3C77_693010 [compost metagenome]